MPRPLIMLAEDKDGTPILNPWDIPMTSDEFVFFSDMPGLTRQKMHVRMNEDLKRRLSVYVMLEEDGGRTVFMDPDEVSR